ncbi:MAG: hypothetical protein GX854_14275 [Clostridiales bacterium]|nr:hypothetical protein [Clostridiales bacterium]
MSNENDDDFMINLAEYQLTSDLSPSKDVGEKAAMLAKKPLFVAHLMRLFHQKSLLKIAISN